MARVERTREIGDKISTEIVCLITSLVAAVAGAERLLALVCTAWRGHRAVENRLHDVCDVSMNEDRCRCRAGAHALAALRNLTTFLIRKSGVPIPEARENFREDRAAAILAATGRIF